MLIRPPGRQPLSWRSFAMLTVGAMFALPGCNSTSAVPHASGVAPTTPSSKVVSKFRHGGPTGSTISVDVRQYMAAVISQYDSASSPSLTGNMLCNIVTTKADDCNTSFKDGYGEAEILGSKGNGFDFVGITSWNHPTLGSCTGSSCTSPYYIGIIRNYTGPASGDVLRCFSTPSDACGVEPPTASIMPEGVPYLIPDLPVVGVDALTDASNPNGSPSGPIAGALLTTPPKNGTSYWLFGSHQWNGSPPCTGPDSQNYTTKNYIVYVKNVDFQGNIGVQDAIVTDGYSTGATVDMNHVERYFYVLGYGRMRGGYAFWNKQDQKYDLNDHNSDKGNYLPIKESYFNPTPVQCHQGSYIKLWP